MISLSLIGFWSNAQGKSAETKLDRTVREWKSMKSDDLVNIEYRFADCDPTIGFNKEIVQLQFTNKTDQKVELSWHIYMYYNGVCKTCDYPQEYVYTLTLDPHQSVSGDCSLESDSRLTIFSRFIDQGYKGNQMLTNFDLHDLTITPIK